MCCSPQEAQQHGITYEKHGCYFSFCLLFAMRGQQIKPLCEIQGLMQEQVVEENDVESPEIRLSLPIIHLSLVFAL